MTLDELISMALDGRSILFVGSGFTIGAVNENNRAVPNVDSLLKYFNASELGKPFKDYRTAAERYMRDGRFGAARAYAELKREFSVKSYASFHKSVISLPWKRIYTTNYDDLIEKCLNSAGKPFRSLNAAKDADPYERDKVSVVHLNGNFSEMGCLDFDSLIRLTESSYIAERFSQRPYFASFRNELRTSGAVVFVGYSMADIDVAKLLKDVREVEEKTVLVIGPAADEEEIYSLSKYGLVAPIGVEKFAKEIEKQKLTHQPVLTKKNYYCLRKFTIQPNPFDRITDRDRYDLYVYGVFKPQLHLLQDSEASGSVYSVERDGVRSFLGKISKKPAIGYVHGDLASGKSVFVQQLCCELDRTNFDVWLVEKVSEFLLEEIESVLLNSTKNIIIIFDNYELYISEIRYILEQYKTDVSLLLSSSTHLHELNRATVSRANSRSIAEHEYNINTLSNAEIAGLSRALLTGELRGAFKVNATVVDIENIVVTRCRRMMRDVLLYLLDSKYIENRIRQVFNSAEMDTQGRRFILICCIIKLLQANLTLGEMEDAFLSGEPFYSGFFRRNEIKAIMRFDEFGHLSLSPAMAQYYTTRLFDPNEVRDALLRVAKRSYELSSHRVYDSLYRACMQHGRIKELFSPSSVDDEIIGFYDQVKNMNFFRQNPYFWLQYAIARWHKRERDLTDSCIKLAREAGERIAGFKAFQIDHFESVVRLEYLMDNGLTPKYRGDVEYAVKILETQIDDEKTKYYPLRLCVTLERFVSEVISNLSRNDKKFISDAILRVSRVVETSDKKDDYPQEAGTAIERLAKAARLLR
ncbi:SIR2 family protein [Rhodoplanes sp. TEM]|uniref:SIR2 family protein n=1 Tax=Rhodoplanes tepidamans TaxID=200616 RepID=A0ABT5J5H7_RHOTP|nr:MULTISPECIES: SIR2 family protein [Rhodoplanes]MDC7784295.1 SIR2 family protein [Rhodoplanes tepidamans]MDC7983687.1 SIR2 family protein [Rhodoplanes sp. TEM]MDQ0353697.1 hypothetical protein [Rhodoplanes tepidamans]